MTNELENKSPSRLGLSSSILGMAFKYAEAVQARIKAEAERDEIKAELDRMVRARQSYRNTITTETVVSIESLRIRDANRTCCHGGG